MQPTKDIEMNEKMQNVVGLGLGLGKLDFNLIEATLASIETKSLTPIIKEELKLKIQTQRLASGKSELPTPIFKEPEKCELTPEEEIKRDHRRERNRIAATKCRNKRKSQSEQMKTTLAEEELRNYTLKRKLEELENEKKEVLKKLKLQQISTNNSPPPVQQQQHKSTKFSSTLTTSPSPTPTFTNQSIDQSSFLNMPSTSSGIFGQVDVNTTPRRYSDDLPRNLGALNYNCRRFSADSCQNFCSFNQQQYESVEPVHAFQFERHITNISDKSEKNLTETKTYAVSEHQASTLQDLDIDILSDEEFFRFENETIPFGQYQIDNQSDINLPATETACKISSDGCVRQDNKEETSECFEKHLEQQEHRSYLVNLIPVFEDEAMVPECNEADADRFAVSPGPTSPTFY